MDSIDRRNATANINLNRTIDDLIGKGVTRCKIAELAVTYSHEYNNAEECPIAYERIDYVRERLKSWWEVHKHEYN